MAVTHDPKKPPHTVTALVQTLQDGDDPQVIGRFLIQSQGQIYNAYNLMVSAAAWASKGTKISDKLEWIEETIRLIGETPYPINLFVNIPLSNHGVLISVSGLGDYRDFHASRKYLALP